MNDAWNCLQVPSSGHLAVVQKTPKGTTPLWSALRASFASRWIPAPVGDFVVVLGELERADTHDAFSYIIIVCHVSGVYVIDKSSVSTSFNSSEHVIRQ